MSFKIGARYSGDGQCELTHGLSGNTMVTDLPPDNGGKGRTFSPTDLAAASVASCVLTIMAKIAEREGLDFRGASFEIEKHMQENPRRIARLTGVITLPPCVEGKSRDKVLAAIRACPVSRSLHPDVRLEFEVR